MTVKEEKLIEEMINRSKEHCVDDVDYSVPFLINLIEKQSKEIKELKDTNKKLYEMGKKNAIQELINNDYISKDKIKAKIEDKESQINDIKDNLDYDAIMVNEVRRLENEIEVLQSLLEKEFPTTITKEDLEKRWEN